MAEIEKLGEKLQTNIWEEKSAKQKQEGRKTMSVMEMGKILGLRKTESYWLANKHYFKLIQIRGRMRVNIKSFEKWYANQVKYRKVDGEPPGKELIRTSYSPQDISKMLGICEQGVYDLIRRKNLPVITVDYWMRVPKKAFDNWYNHQDHYRNQADRERDAASEAESLAMTEIARILGVHRNNVYSMLRSPRYKDQFEIISIAGKKRITKKSFNAWYETHGRVRKHPSGTPEVEALAPRLSQSELYYTLDDIAGICGCSKSTPSRWIRKGYFTSRKVGHLVMVSRQEFDKWYEEYQAQGGSK